MNNKYVLVTGGAGYIGSHTCKYLDSCGFKPIVFDNLITGHKWAVKWGPLIVGDLLNKNDLYNVFSRYNFVAVIHFAAHAYVGESVINPMKYYRNNVVGTLNLIDSMVDFNIKCLIFSSTCSTYGVPKSNPISETHHQHPINPYGYSKLTVERIIHDYHKAYGINYAILRYFNAAGADLDTEIGENHDPETHLIPLAIQAVFDKNFTLELFGDDFETRDGSAIRDYIHVNDLAQAHVLSLEKVILSECSLCINLGTGNGFSVKEIIHEVERLTGKIVKFRIAQKRIGDPPELIADSNKAYKEIKWRPKYSSISSIIGSSINWYLSHSE